MHKERYQAKVWFIMPRRTYFKWQCAVLRVGLMTFFSSFFLCFPPSRLFILSVILPCSRIHVIVLFFLHFACTKYDSSEKNNKQKYHYFFWSVHLILGRFKEKTSAKTFTIFFRSFACWFVVSLSFHNEAFVAHANHGAHCQIERRQSQRKKNHQTE